MIITVEKLKELKACDEGIRWFEAQDKSEISALLHALLESNHTAWANWLIVRLMAHKQKAQYAVFAAEQVLNLFETKYPDDNRPRLAIESVKAWIEKPSVKATKPQAAAAYAAAGAAEAAANAAAAYAAGAAEAAACAAACAACDATYAVACAAYAAAHAAAANAACAADAARRTLQLKIINYGLTLLGETEGK